MNHKSEVGNCSHKGHSITLYRDDHGKFYIYIDAVEMQKRLNATELARWFLHKMHEEKSKEPPPSDDVRGTSFQGGWG